VAAISGFCLGAGAELAMMSDIVVASETVRFGLPETALGLIPGAGGTQLLAHAAGKAVAMDVILSGRLLNAEELMRAGVVSRVASLADYRNLAYEIAATVAERPPLAQKLKVSS
jgi:enoyl-CoA hydratase